jgi:hypothetical protein
VSSRAKAPTSGSVRIATLAAITTALFVLAVGASPASAEVGELRATEATEIEPHTASLNGYYVNFGAPEVHYYFEWGETVDYGHTTPSPPGLAGPEGIIFFPPVPVSGLSGGATYHFRLVASDADNTAYSPDSTFTTPSGMDNLVAEQPTAITDQSAELHGSFIGDGTSEVHYFYEWGPSTTYGNKTPAPPGTAVPPTSEKVELEPASISALERGGTYHFRVAATNAEGTNVSPDVTFSTAEAPVVSNVRSANVTESTAELRGDINPRWGQTTYRFEWGLSPAYGNSIPVSGGDLDLGNAKVPVTAVLEDLNPGLTYHFRLVASNEYGTTASPDQAFGFYPASCPNSQLRQETRSNDLPDCRAYELVSPTFAAGATIMPASGPTASLATNPARIAYGVVWGLFDESTGEGMNGWSDAYVSTRSATGWTNRYVGIQGGSENPPAQGTAMGGPPAGGFGVMTGYSPVATQRGAQASPNLDRLINYNWGYPGQIAWAGTVGSNVPYVWDTSNGKLLARWPKNFSEVPDADHAVGVPQASTDFTHLVFTSSAVYAEGGEGDGLEIECCGFLPTVEDIWPKASVYDYDVGADSVVLASRRKDGTPFKGRAFDISEDGSHILMTEDMALGPNIQQPPEPKEFITESQITGPLYLRVDGNETFEIAPGRKIEYAGSTSDGATVYLASDEQLTPDDHDSSRDLFVWHESEPDTLTRVSVGNHGDAGDTDACASVEAWSVKCGISVIHMTSHFGVTTGNGHTDNYLSSASGDIYFESPEQLVGAKGAAGERNVYLYREGSVRFVTTMTANNRIARMQVTPDGRHMALTTGSNLTEYNSAGHLEMYLFDPEVGRVVCASCRPDGQPPVADVTGSQNGLFLTNDGRAFFATTEPLVPRDTNEEIDVYEFTEGKAQLITTGLGPGIALTAGLQQYPGLVNVSANGTDVYFATTDVLVTQDHNGSQLKIYDARTGGGFPAERDHSNCAAADECHGPITEAPALPADRTSAGFGTPSMAKPAPKGKQHKKARKHRKKRSKKAQRGGRRHG